MDIEKAEKAAMYLNLYNEYQELTEQLGEIADRQNDVHLKLCEAAKEFLGMSDEELHRLIFYFDSIATDAKGVLEY